MPGKKLVLRASNQEERDDWVNTLRKAMEELKSPGGDSDVEAEEGGRRGGEGNSSAESVGGDTTGLFSASRGHGEEEERNGVPLLMQIPTI